MKRTRVGQDRPETKHEREGYNLKLHEERCVDPASLPRDCHIHNHCKRPWEVNVQITCMFH